MSLNIINIIEFLGLTQGVILGIVLIAGHKNKRPSLFLGLFLLTYSLQLLNSLLIRLSVYSHAINLHFLPVNFYFFSVPMFYLYAKQLVTGGWNKKWWWYFVPGALEFLVFAVLLMLPGEYALSIMMRKSTQMIYSAYVVVSLLYSIVFAIMTNRLVSSYQDKILNYFSDAGLKQLCWIKGFGRALAIIYLVLLVDLFAPLSFGENYLNPLLSVTNIIFIYWIGISGLLQPRVEMVIEDEQSIAVEEEKAVHVLKDDPDRKACFASICAQIESKELYKNPKLTLPLLAKMMNISRKEMSYLINYYAGCNFSTFINLYRVDAAKQLLVDTGYHHLNMVGIAYEVGFSSKATFFAVFKKLTGTSPGKYKKEELEKLATGNDANDLPSQQKLEKTPVK